MKITITQDFDSVEQAAEFLARVGNPTQIVNTVVSPVLGTDQALPGKARKPRSDAGKPREPYGPRTPTTGEPVASEPGVPGSASAPAPQPAAPATPTQPSAPTLSEQQSTASPQVAPGNAPATEPAAEGTDPRFPLTEEGVRLAMQCLNKTKGQGTEACWAALRAHGVVRITELPKEKFDEFIKYVLAKSSKEGIAEALKVGAPPKKGAAK